MAKLLYIGTRGTDSPDDRWAGLRLRDLEANREIASQEPEADARWYGHPPSGAGLVGTTRGEPGTIPMRIGLLEWGSESLQDARSSSFAAIPKLSNLR